MLSSITPFGERSRNTSWSLTVSAYLLASVAGGATTGLVFGSVGEALDGPVGDRAALVALGVLAIMGLAADNGVAGLRLPGPHRQVNERWLMAYRGWVYGAGFGFQLGMSVATIVTTSAVWLTWAVAILAGSWRIGLVLGAVFGLTRGIVILAARHVDTPDQLRLLHHRIAEQSQAVSRMAKLTVGLTALTAILLGLSV